MSRAGICIAAMYFGIGVSGCTRIVTVPELDLLTRSLEARTVVLDPGLSLYSPLAPEATLELRTVLAAEHEAVVDLLATEPGKPVLVFLMPPRDAPLPAGHGSDAAQLEVLGFASERGIIVYLERDKQLTLTGERSMTILIAAPAERYRGTIRHELVHVYWSRAGLGGAPWLEEGVAQAVESMVLVAGKLRWTGPATVGADVREEALRRGIGEILAWREDLRAILAGREEPDRWGRPIAAAWSRFLIERMGDVPFRTAVERIAAMPRGELVSLSSEWHGWLGANAGGES